MPFEFWYCGEIKAGMDQFAASADIQIHPLTFKNLFSLEHQEWMRGIIAFASGKPALEPLGKTGLPIVNVSGNQKSVPFPSVLNDSREMGRIAARHMIECGARQLVYASVTASTSFFLTERVGGVIEICNLAGVELERFEPKILKTQNIMKSQSEWETAAVEWLDTRQPPFAIIAADPLTAEVFHDAIRRRGWTVGAEVALIQLTDPEEEIMGNGRMISYIPNDWRSVGRLAAQSLYRWMVEGEIPPSLQLVPPLKPVLTSTSDPSQNASLVVRVRSYLTHSSDFGTTTGEVAAKMGVSVSTLYRQFQREAGHSLKHELLARRLSHACDLLRTTALPVADIASRCGYSTGHSFAASFRQQYGEAPAAWRKHRVTETS